ncbi:hypothetical protein L5F32_03735 [Aliarcobacter butzleri]|uniref:hypothetical protein n=1 Tax=Aliarcobacter butzleri TaxID=28197 RepID=UPI001EDA9559|nr:hypothetical protein [Aliarcobacter butzleri]MCG3651379.1 hypothetical protein [Aliarcobacter butzleri]
MPNSGVKRFQEERTNIAVNLINEACKYLLEKNENITAKKIEEKIRKLAKKKNIDDKYLVDEQSIRRNKKYKTIYANYKSEQNNIKKEQNNAKKDIEQFSLRDKFDLISQNYLELLDEKNFLNKLYLDTKNEKEKLEKLLKVNNIYSVDRRLDSKKSAEVIKIMNKLLEKGAVILKRDDNKIILKSYNQKEDDRYEFSADEWDSIIC